MVILLYILIGVIAVIILIGLIGLLLPRERVVTRQTIFPAPPEKVYNVVINNEDFWYRRDVKEVRILEQNGDYEVWEETAYKGNVMLFRTREKKPYSFYSFDMEGNLFTGYWTAEFSPTNDGTTLFIATEHIRIQNPFLKTLSYPLFNIGKFMENYQEDLKIRLRQK